MRTIFRERDADGRRWPTYADERLVSQPRFAEGFNSLSSDVYSRNVETLSGYLGGP